MVSAHPADSETLPTVMQNTLVPMATKRLTIRELVSNDLDPVFDTLRPETSGGRVFEKKTIIEAESWLRNRIAEQEELGYSIWAVEIKDGDVVGVCGLIPGEPAPMICYAIRKCFQGHGFGTEAAKAVISRAAEKFGSVIATVRQSNIASIHVAGKIGMRESNTAYSNDPEVRSFMYP